ISGLKADGTLYWRRVFGPMNDVGSFKGDGVQFAFNSPSAGTMADADGTWPIHRFVFDVRFRHVASSSPAPAHYRIAGVDDDGLFLERQGGSLYIGLFGNGKNGIPIWRTATLGQMPRQEREFEGEWRHYALRPTLVQAGSLGIGRISL